MVSEQHGWQGWAFSALQGGSRGPLSPERARGSFPSSSADARLPLSSPYALWSQQTCRYSARPENSDSNPWPSSGTFSVGRNPRKSFVLCVRQCCLNDLPTVSSCPHVTTQLCGFGESKEDGAPACPWLLCSWASCPLLAPPPSECPCAWWPGALCADPGPGLRRADQGWTRGGPVCHCDHGRCSGPSAGQGSDAFLRKMYGNHWCFFFLR